MFMFRFFLGGLFKHRFLTLKSIFRCMDFFSIKIDRKSLDRLCLIKIVQLNMESVEVHPFYRITQYFVRNRFV